MNKVFASFLFIGLFMARPAYAANPDGYVFDFAWGGTTSEGSQEDGKFYTPLGIAISPVGDVYVADTSNRRIQKFTSSGDFVTKWGSLGSDPGKFQNPRSVEVGADGIVYVGDSENSRIQKFTPDGAFVSTYSSYWAEHFAVDHDGNVYIGLQGFAGKIQKYAPDGTPLAEFSAVGVTSGLAIRDGHLYAASRADNLVQKFTLGGTLVDSWGTGGTAEGQLNNPRGIAIDSNGNIVVADSANNRIQIFDPSGNFILSFGMAGTAEGQFSMPYDIAIDSADRIYVADASNNRIQVFTPEYSSAPTVTPEPASMLLFGLGSAALGFARTRRKARDAGSCPKGTR